jgi:hypothetical protein
VRNKKATGDDALPVDALTLWGENGLRLMAQLISSLYETGQWPKDFTEFPITTLKKKPKATNCSDYRTVSLNAHAAKISARIH